MKKLILCIAAFVAFSAWARPLLVGISEDCADGKRSGVKESYCAAVRKGGNVPVVVCRTARAEDLAASLAPLDLLIMPGGEDVDPASYGAQPSAKLGKVNLARDAFERDLYRAALARELPILGICRGEQHLNVMMGGTLYQDLPETLGDGYTVEHRPSDKGKRKHQIDVAPGTRLAGVAGAGAVEVNTSHHQAVKGLAPGLSVSARSPDGVVEAVECGWYPAAGVQFHPEDLSLSGKAIGERIFANPLAFTGRASTVPARERPIGVFDSGIGGLTVLEKLLTVDAVDNATGAAGADGKPDLARESFVYFGDQANMPYGLYEAMGKADFLRELVVRDAQFLMGAQGHVSAKIIVIACNTATAYGYDILCRMPRPRNVRVIGVVNAGVEAVLDELDISAGTDPVGIAVMATPGTIASGAYERTLRAALKARGVTRHVEIENRKGWGLAESVENGLPGTKDCARTNLVALVESYAARGAKAPLKALVLGCTHYPFVQDVFEKTLDDLRKDSRYAHLIAPDFKFIDPAVYTAIACQRALREDGLLADGEQKLQAFISVGKDGPLPQKVKYGRDTGMEDIGTRVAPMSRETVPLDTFERVGALLPATRRMFEPMFNSK